MEKSRLLGTVCACLAAVSINANAVVVNTLNGVDYEWLELTATAGMSRLAVEAQLSDATSALYGYEYASRALVEDLLLSYSSWDRTSGSHVDSAVITGGEYYLDDFGRTYYDPGDGVTDPVPRVVDGDPVDYDGRSLVYGWFGSRDECSTVDRPDRTCISLVELFTDALGNGVALYQSGHLGWEDALGPITTSLYTKEDTSFYGSHLVKIASVPTPAAVWLFGSGLLGLIGAARRKARV